MTTGKQKRVNARTAEDWLQLAKRNGMKVELVISDKGGNIEESILVPLNRVADLGINVGRFQKRVTTLHGDAVPTKRAAA